MRRGDARYVLPSRAGVFLERDRQNVRHLCPRSRVALQRSATASAEAAALATRAFGGAKWNVVEVLRTIRRSCSHTLAIICPRHSQILIERDAQSMLP